MPTPQPGNPISQADDKPHCVHCKQRPVQACDECRRALALRMFWTISRHPESIQPGDAVCLMCSAGPASLCGVCLVDQAAAYRQELREGAGHDIANWGDNIDHFGQRRVGQQLYATGRATVDRAASHADPAARDALQEIGDQMIEQGLALAEPFGGI